MKTLYEKYRPQAFSEVIGQDKVLAKIKTIAKRGIGGRCFWISGQSGTGKTTIAKLIGQEIASPDFIDELDAGDLSVSHLRTIEQTLQLYSFGKGGRCYIINEAHGISKSAIRQLLVLLERIPDHVCIIFTTTIEGQKLLFDNNEDTSPLLSRCIRLELARRDLAKPFAVHARDIATKENLNGKPLESYVRLVQQHRNNLRAVLQSIETGDMLE